MKLWQMLIAFVFIFSNCNSNQKKGMENGNNDSSLVQVYKPKTGLEAEPSISLTDSIEILYYDNPDGDPERYTRFYKYTITTEQLIIDALLSELDQPFDENENAKSCRSEGKIYLFNGQQALKTIYFSTRCDTCCYIYYIRNGKFFYFPISEKFSRELRGNRENAKSP
jgi:hypothetical protein